MKSNFFVQKQLNLIEIAINSNFLKSANKCWALILFLILPGFFSKAQPLPPAQASVNNLMNTGFDANTNSSTVPIGLLDQRWKAGPNPSPVQSAVVVNSIVPWSGTSQLTAWIGPPNLNCGSPVVLTNYTCVAPSANFYYYEYQFNLATCQALILEWIIFASGWLDEIRVNGSIAYKTAVVPSSPPYHAGGTGVYFHYCTNWKYGPGTTNTISVKVGNDPNKWPFTPHTGLKIESFNTFQAPVGYQTISGSSIVCPTNSYNFSLPPTTNYAPSITPSLMVHSWTKPTGWIGTSTTNILGVITNTNGGCVTSNVYTTYINAGITQSVCIATGAFSVTVPPPLIVIPPNPIICSGTCVTLSAFNVNTYTWTQLPGQNHLTNAANVLLCPNATTSYSVKGYTPLGPCLYSKSVTVVVNQSPTVTIGPTNQTVCVGTPVSQFATSNAISYTWTPNPNTTPNNSQTMFTPLTSGVQIYSVSVKDANGCTNSAQNNVTVHPVPSVTVTSNPTVICSGQTATLTATGANSYYWLPPNIWSQTVAVSPSVSTVYSAMGVNNFNCHSTTFYQQNVIGSPSVVVMPLTICSGVQNTLSASGAVNYTVLVGIAPNQSTYTGGINSPNNTFDVVLNLTAGTTYTVYGTGPNNLCIGNTTGTISMGNPIPLTVSNVTLCTNASNCAILTASSSLNAPISYTWGTIGPFGASALFCPLVNTNYMVSATSPSACANSATADIIVLSHCCSQPTTGLTVLNHTAGLSGTYSNTSYLLGSSVTLTSSTTFSHSEVWMLPGVKITVPSGMYFEMERSRFFACGINMWQGIEIQDGGWIKTLNGNLHSNLIEDAEIGIDLSNISVTNSSPLPPINLEEVVFNKNFIGIRIANSDQALDSLAIGINGCVFTSRTFTYVSHPSPPPLDWPSANDNCLTTTVSAALRCALSPTAGLAPPFISNTTFPFSALKHPHSSHPGHIGIQIKTIGLQSPTTLINNLPAGVQFGITYTTTPGDFNLFDGLGVGIEVTDASFVTMNNVFQNMKEYGYANSFGQFGGKGVMHVIQPNNLMNARLDLTGSSTSDGNRFYDCRTGVFASHVYQNWIRFCLFRSKHDISTALSPMSNPGDTGVSICTNRLNQTIGYNEFNNLKHGLVLSTGTASCFYDVAGSGTTLGTYIYGLDIKYNYFGPQVNSTTGYGAGAPNLLGSEYMSSAIEIGSPNTNFWTYPSGATGFIAGIHANKINRAFRGISLDGFEDTPFEIGANEIFVEQDYTYGNPAYGYGIAIKNNNGNLAVKFNTLESAPWHSPQYLTTPTVALIYCNNNNGSSSSTIKSPIIECNRVKNSYIGFCFDGSNASTSWEGNEMCNNYYGMALLNNGIIGVQGSPGLASGNIWEDNVPWGGTCRPWPSSMANFHTYCENSDPSQSFLYVVATPVHEPINNHTNLFPFLYAPVTSYDNTSTLNRLVDCFILHSYPSPPAWKSSSSNQIPTTESIFGLFNDLRIHPNPAYNSLTLSLMHNTDDALFIIRDLSGRALLHYEIKSSCNSAEIDVTPLSGGIYFLEFYENERIIGTKKFIKNN